MFTHLFHILYLGTHQRLQHQGVLCLAAICGCYSIVRHLNFAYLLPSLPNAESFAFSLWHRTHFTMKLLIALPLVLSTAAFILSLLSLLAGYKQGFMEDYNLLTLNTSALGQQAIQQIASGQSPTPTTGGSEIGSIIASATALLPSSLSSEASSILGQVGSSVAEQLSDELGISEFYSIHAMDFCQGSFQPNATTIGASHNVTNCSAPLDFGTYLLVFSPRFTTYLNSLAYTKTTDFVFTQPRTTSPTESTNSSASAPSNSRSPSLASTRTSKTHSTYSPKPPRPSPPCSSSASSPPD